jgi:glycosyltransferase involved in cell wall biosynthesis
LRPAAPAVHIGMPVFNGEKTIHRAIDSLLRQTFSDFELIISDNASTDETAAICRDYAARDSRIKYFRQKKNEGATTNFIFVLNQASADYFMWAAADDQWAPTYLWKCVDLLKGDVDAGFVITRYQVTSRLSRWLRRWGIPPLNLVAEPVRERRVFRYSAMPFSTHKDNLVYALWRRTAIEQVVAEVRDATGTSLIGGAMNEYALSIYRGGFVNEVLFLKTYKWLPPGHKLTPIFQLGSRLIRFFSGRPQHAAGEYGVDIHLSHLHAILERAGFDDDYIANVIEENSRHCRR